MHTAEELYKYYRNQKTPFATFIIEKDMGRTDVENADYQSKGSDGYNALFGILNAYAHYDKAVGYAQGMNFIAAYIIKYTSHKKVLADGTNKIIYNETQAFYFFIHVLSHLEWREIFSPGMERLLYHLQIIEELLATGFPQIYEHIMEESSDMGLYPMFGSLIISVFISDLQRAHPSTLIRIFDVFLIHGESAIFTLLLKIIETQQSKILTLQDTDLILFMKNEAHYKCLSENEMHELLDFQAE